MGNSDLQTSLQGRSKSQLTRPASQCKPSPGFYIRPRPMLFSQSPCLSPPHLRTYVSNHRGLRLPKCRLRTKKNNEYSVLFQIFTLATYLMRWRSTQNKSSSWSGRRLSILSPSQEPGSLLDFNRRQIPSQDMGRVRRATQNVTVLPTATSQSRRLLETASCRRY